MKYIESKLLASAIFILSVMLPSAVWAQSEHQLTVVAKPTMAGSFNKSSVTLAAGETIQLVAYANSNFTFVQWTDESGTVVSKQMDLDFIMPDYDCQLIAEYEYNPTNPANPVRNYWNKLTGEVIVDDFSTGQLQNAVKTAIDNNKAADVMMITVAGVMSSNDFGILNTYSSCALLDISRVSGVTEVPSYAFDNTKLETMYLPASIERIGNQAFYGCKQLSSMTIYAMTPPSLGSNVFTNVPEGLVVYVPAAAIGQYQDALGWKDFILLPIQEDIRSISISLPDGANAQDYAQMWLELINTKNGQRIHYVMTDRMQYTFPNIIRNTSWNVVLRNERGNVFGQIDNVEVKDEDVAVAFSSLSKPQNVLLTVLTPDGQDVTSQTQITWIDAQGNYVAQGTSLSGLPVGYQTNYRVVLSQELAMMYNTPSPVEYTLKDGSNNITCQLEAIKQVQISGKVKDSSTGLPLSGAVVGASQTFGGKYSKTLNAKTNSKGEYLLSVADVPTSFAFAASDYISQTISFDQGLSELNEFEDVLLKTIIGATISIGFTYTTVEGETQNWYSDYQNVSYALYNVTKNRTISQFSVQYPQIVLLEEVEDGDVLRLTATSRTSAFKAVEATATIAEQKAEATFAIIELGQIQASFVKNGNASVVGSLYDAAGKLVKTYDYANASLTISNLSDGSYTLVTMGSSRLFNTIYDLAQLPQTGLTEGTDYVVNAIEVKSGAISQISIDEVPTLDESKLYYTGDNTSFTVNKPSIVAGNYLTLTGRIDFKPAYAMNVSNVQMIVDLPESCEFVENSVMVGNSTSSYTLNGNQVVIPMTRYTDRVRFCIIPTLGGDYAPSAFVQFDLNGETVTQPIGSANYTTKDLSISVPSIVAKTSVPISGTAIGSSNIEIYDNGVLIGQTTSLANGTWATMCELNEPYNLSRHRIYAKVRTKQNVELISESKECLYDRNVIEVKSVKMCFYNGWLRKNVEVLFDYESGTTTGSYMFYTGTDVTFIANLTANDTVNVRNVTFCVLTDRNEIRHIEGAFNKEIGKWIAVCRFESNNLPINVYVDIDCQHQRIIDSKINSTIINTLDGLIAENARIHNQTDSVYNAIDAALSTDKPDWNFVDSLLTRYDNYESSELDEYCYLDSLTEEELSNYITNLNDESLPFIEQSMQEIEEIEKSILLFSVYNEIDAISEDGRLHMKRTIMPCNGMSIDSLLNNGYTKITNIENVDILEKMTDDEYGFVDFKNNIFIHKAKVGHSLSRTVYRNKEESQWKDYIQSTITEISKSLATNEDLLVKDHLSKMSIKQKNDYLFLKKMESDYAYAERAMKRTIARTSNPFKVEILKDELEKITIIRKKVGKLKAKHTMLPENLSRAGKAALSAFDWKSWYMKVKTYSDRIESWQTPECIYSIKPGMVPIVEDKINEIRREFERYYGWQFARKALYNVSDALTGPAIGIMLAVYEDGVERQSDELFERDFNANIMQVEKWLTDMYHHCGLESPYESKGPIFTLPSTNPIHDPSGYVYEGVHTNRLEGVTATAYYKEDVEDMYGDLHEHIVKWDAEEYAQENPLFTDENGMYRWDVPQGLWQVKFEKEGYETTYSEWLPVPPPQLDVNIALKQNVQPMVKQARAFEDAVEAEFDKYMLPELLTTENVIVMQGGKPVDGTIELLNEEASYENSDETFASKLRFNAALPFAEQEVTLMVSNRVKSYAGIRMQDDFSQTFTVEQEIKQIVCEEQTEVDYGDKATLAVSVLPASASKGKTLKVMTSSTMILGVEAEQVIIDEEGKAEITLSGELPGTAALTFSVEGTDKTAITIVNIQQKVDEFVAAPTANIASGSTVEVGTQITLFCKTEGATIYYTLDGSCPCDNTAARKVYNDGTPIVINENAIIKAMAVAPDMTESDVVEFTYIVATPTSIEEIALNGEIQVFPLPIRDKLNVRAGGKTIKNVTVSSMKGVVVAESTKAATKITLDVSPIPTGLYIINVTTEDGAYNRKVLKVE